jgi:hypothetical protein
MSFPISPGVYKREIDQSIVSGTNIGTSAALAGKFNWGPIGEIVRVADEGQLVSRFGKPTDDNGVDFFVAASYLAYANALDLVRVGKNDVAGPKNAISDAQTAVYIPNDDAYDQEAVSIASASYVAKYAGSLGNSISISTCASSAQFQSALPGDWTFTRSATVTYTPDATEVLSAYITVGDYLVVDGVRYLIASINDLTDTLTLNKIYTGSLTPSTVLRRWKFANRFVAAPASSRAHVVVFDADGKITGEVGAVLESYDDVSRVETDKLSDGSSAYFLSRFAGSSFIRAGGEAPDALALKAEEDSLTGGDDGYAVIGDDDYIEALSLFIPNENFKAPLIIGGEIDDTLSPFIVQNIADVRRDGVAFFSPKLASVLNNKGNEATDIVTDRQILGSTSYGAMDDNWKYMYDKYNDKYRWIPCAADHAGLYARVDRENDPWVSAAGTSRGLIKGAVKLAWNSREADRDVLYPNNVNSIVDFPASGPTLFGDKTLLSVNSALSRIPTRRLLLLVEEIIVESSASMLFEFNDEFTRARFNSQTEPFLRGIQGRRGLDAFKVVADESVNTPQVVANNQFVGQIYIKPNYSINFIRIDFIVVGATVSIEEVVGVA